MDNNVIFNKSLYNPSLYLTKYIKSQSNPPSVGGPTMAFPVIITHNRTHFRQQKLIAPFPYSVVSLLCIHDFTLISKSNKSFLLQPTHTHYIRWCVYSDDQSLYIHLLFHLYTYNGVTYCLYILFLAYTLMVILLLLQAKLLFFLVYLFYIISVSLRDREKQRKRDRERYGEEKLEIVLGGFGSCGADNL